MATSKLQVNVVIPTQTRYLELIDRIGKQTAGELSVKTKAIIKISHGETTRFEDELS